MNSNALIHRIGGKWADSFYHMLNFEEKETIFAVK